MCLFLSHKQKSELDAPLFPRSVFLAIEPQSASQLVGWLADALALALAFALLVGLTMVGGFDAAYCFL